ncbi:hypothetical protein CK203_023146 [Vitis vinifera]|uniref:Uncharacterized protein n=1 Tax=Vitis vinifera TaxID=29760 RepID=A0A438J1U4_VITVI|nr:hypothetical protein CK203_023146 [Vitis vinifera]
MDQQVVIVDQFTTAMTSIQEALASVRQKIGVQTMVIDDAHARMDLLEQRMKQLRVSDGSAVWDDLEGMPMASLPAKFRMPDIERYTDIGCPRIHLRLYSMVMRAHGLDESQMITLFPLSLNVSRRELKALRQRADESISSFISRLLGTWSGVPFIDFGSLVLALYDVEDGISRVLPVRGLLGVISRFHSIPRLILFMHLINRPRAPCPTYDQTYMPQTLALPYYATQGIEKPSSSVDFCSIRFEDAETVFTVRHAIEPDSLEAYRGRVLDRFHSQATTLAYSTSVQDGSALCIPSRAWTRDRSLHHFEVCYPGLDRSGFGTLGSAEYNHKLVTRPHYTCSSPSANGIHFLDFSKHDDYIHMLSWDDTELEPVVSDGIYEMDGATLGPRMPAPF